MNRKLKFAIISVVIPFWILFAVLFFTAIYYNIRDFYKLWKFKMGILSEESVQLIHPKTFKFDAPLQFNTSDGKVLSYELTLIYEGGQTELDDELKTAENFFWFFTSGQLAELSSDKFENENEFLRLQEGIQVLINDHLRCGRIEKAVLLKQKSL
ncbi:hypothetical protein EHQ61_07690 [Leptospira wolffii]|uniref:hypothetical protein n=1 Tax=Leptospira wolffii TaxID=409998 RepID=UPI0010828648|nr:hypothetical protein [Leptospira wolffii]TGL51835.1 hypothetical protein EHQ61_07690 [Leptospira wolffii]